MLHSVLGAYTCYRPDVGYVSELSIFYRVSHFKKKVRITPVVRDILAARARRRPSLLLGMESLMAASCLLLLKEPQTRLPCGCVTLKLDLSFVFRMQLFQR